MKKQFTFCIILIMPIILSTLFLFSIVLTSAVLNSSLFNCYASAPAHLQQDTAEQELLDIINLISKQQTEKALLKSNILIQKYPNFKLAQSIRDDILYSQYNALDEPFVSSTSINHKSKLLSEANVRLDAGDVTIDKLEQKIPNLVHYIDQSTPYFFIIDFSVSRLYLFKNNKKSTPKLIADHYVTIGSNGSKKLLRGDKKTPLGVYHVTSFLNDQQLPELYGWGAFPINYPNAWDKKHQRTGSGIWLHGVPRDTYSRPPLDSKGCLVISNDFLINISQHLKINTPIILADSLEWTDKSNYKKNVNHFKKHIYKWKSDWEHKNLKQYLSHYSKNFKNTKKTYLSWAKHKKRIFKKTKKIKIKISQLSIFSYPGEGDLVSVSFFQNYKGDSYTSRSYKQQYWKREKDNKWRIIYEN